MNLKLILPISVAMVSAYAAYQMYLRGSQIYGLTLTALAVLAAWSTVARIRAWWYGLKDPLY